MNELTSPSGDSPTAPACCSNLPSSRTTNCSLRASSPGGHSLVPDHQYASASTASTIVSQSGLGAFNATQLPKKAGRQNRPRHRPSRQPVRKHLRFCLTHHLETFLQFLNLRFTAPRADELIYLSLLTRLRETVQNRRNDPEPSSPTPSKWPCSGITRAINRSP